VKKNIIYGILGFLVIPFVPAYWVILGYILDYLSVNEKWVVPIIFIAYILYFPLIRLLLGKFKKEPDKYHEFMKGLGYGMYTLMFLGILAVGWFVIIVLTKYFL